MLIDAVLSYHPNPATCGVSKFNHMLARKLGVPCRSLGEWSSFPLVSLKFSETAWLSPFVQLQHSDQFALFVHDAPKVAADREWVAKATTVYAANEVIAAEIRPMRPDVVTAFCPSTLQGNPHRAALNVLTFGMAGRLQLPKFQKLKTLLDGTGQDYTLSVSTAVHEGSPWDAVATVGEQLRDIFGDKTRVLGFLADDALARELLMCSAVALFFDPALRANNTTFWAAKEAGKPVIFNADAHSPCRSELEIDYLEEWPAFLGHWFDEDRRFVSHSWDALLQTMGVTVPV